MRDLSQKGVICAKRTVSLHAGGVMMVNVTERVQSRCLSAPQGEHGMKLAHCEDAAGRSVLEGGVAIEVMRAGLFLVGKEFWVQMKFYSASLELRVNSRLK